MDEDLFSDSSNKSRSSDEENSVIDDSDRDRNYDSEKDSAESSSSEESKEEKLQSKKRRTEVSYSEPQSSEDENNSSEDEEGEEEEDKSDRIDYMASCLSGLSREQLLAKGGLTEERKKKIKKGLKLIKGPPTLSKIDQFFKFKKDQINEELELLKKKHQLCKELALELWSAIESQQRKALELHVKYLARPRKAKFRKQKECQIAGCPGKVANTKRHMAQVHKYMKRSEREKILSLHKKLQTEMKSKFNENKKTPKKKRYPLRRCNICDKEIKRIDIHLQKVHKVQRGPQFFEHMNESLPIEDIVGLEPLDIDAGQVNISSDDGIKSFLNDFKEYLQTCKILKLSSCKSYARNVGQMLIHKIGERPIPHLTPRAICKTLQSVGEEGGYIMVNSNRLAASTRARYVKAALLAIEYLKKTNKINEHLERDASLQLQAAIEERSCQECPRHTQKEGAGKY
ncbi:kinesin-like protein KIF21A [Portunus trituberculatus]|uniref:kinesin-like protein KIF21A n=1 Tax=Portunus trituberculatus TaxID=210409 RepID=UPI001E1D196A|nr:kinesin-like protein KIF21A [Portunus trituberculatus]